MAEKSGFSLFNDQKLKWIEKISENEWIETWRASAFEQNPPVQFTVSVFKKVMSEEEKAKFNDLVTKSASVTHQSLLKIVGFTSEDAWTSRPTIFYEFCSTETLENAITADSLTTTEKLIIVSGIACAAQLFESKGLDIGPVTPNTVFLNSEHEPKLFNFGIPSFFDDQKSPIIAFGSLVKTVMEEDGEMPCFFEDLCAQCESDWVSRMSFEGIVRSFMSEGFLIDGCDPFAFHDYLIKAMSSEFAKKMVIAMFQQSEMHKSHVEELRTDIECLTGQFRRVRKQLTESVEEDRGIYDISQEVKSIRNEMASMKKMLEGFLEPAGHIHLPVSFDKIGIFGYLINSQKSIFDRPVIASQSSGDIYCIINANDPGNFSSGSGNYEWVQFEFKTPITVSSVMVQSAHRAFIRDWSVVAIDDDGHSTTLYQNKQDKRFNGVDKKVTVELPVTTSRIFRIEKMGLNWADTNFIRIKNVEFYAPDGEFENGVFEKLLEKSGGDPHTADVVVTASNFDFRSFHMMSPPRSLCTLYDENNQPWIQFRLTKGKMLVQGYRMQQIAAWQFGKWSLQATVDGKEWVVLDRRSEDVSSSPLKVVSCEVPVPYKIFRVVCEMEKGKGDLKLRFRHFDLFGTYIED